MTPIRSKKCKSQNWKIVALTIIVCLMLASNSYAQTELSGVIDRDSTLVGLIHVTNNITVNPNIKLTIEKGSELKFDGNYQLVVNGHLRVLGEAGSPVVLTSGAGNPSSGSWGGVTINNPSGLSELSHMHIRHASTGLTLSGTPTGLPTFGRLQVNALRVRDSSTGVNISSAQADIYDIDIDGLITGVNISNGKVLLEDGLIRNSVLLPNL